ncbi:hypothetical protein QBC39DRAFT_358721 [Podospora conica]|nr:hypothetical protein QBC39DRAFT_358721 [Schizothecium conicum]
MASPTHVHVTNISAYTPQETIELVSRSGASRANSRPDKIFLSAVSAGCLLGFGAGASLVATTDPWLAENAPGLSRILGATIFPVGVIMIALTGADLFTGGNMCMFPVFCFVALGLDHVVANMFFIPLGIWLHTPGLDVGLYIWKGIIPVTIGNMVGGALFVGGYYWYMYLGFQPPVLVDGMGYTPLASRPSPVMTLKRWHRSASTSAGHSQDSSSTEV